MKKLILVLLLVVGIKTYSQDYNISLSGYTSLNSSKGVELRGEFGDWYMAFHGENFIRKEKYYLNWGGSLGLFRSYSDFDFLGGAKIGVMKIEDEGSKPNFGLELEVDYRLSEVFFIGIRGAHDTYLNSPNVTTPNSESMTRLFIKAGIKF